MASFDQYNKWRAHLADMIDQIVKATKDIAPEKSALYETLGKQLRDDSFKIQVVGTVKNGKSSFSNALIGEPILPVDDIPCTAISSEVKYGHDKKAFVSFYSPLPTGLLDDIPAETAKYLRANNLGKDAKGNNVPIPPFQVDYDHLSDYVTIPEPSMEVMMNPEAYTQYKEHIANESPYDIATLYYPAEMLKDGVELVDSPGLNEHPKRTEVTLNYLKSADAVIYLLDASTPITLDERKVIETVLMPLGFKDIIMVGNKFDLVSRREKSALYLKANTQTYTSIDEFFAVSAKEFHDGTKNSDRALIEKSGIPALKTFLVDFLTKKKGELKINKTANQIINSIKIDFLDSLIPARLDSLTQDSLSLQQKVNAAMPKLTEIEARRQRMAIDFDRKIPVALVPVKEAITEFFNKLAKQIPEWINKYEPKHDCGLYATKNDLEIVAAEITEYTKKKVEEAYNKWNTETLQPILDEQCTFVFGDVKEEMNDIATDIAMIESILSSGKDVDVSATSVIERIAGIVGMAFMPLGRTGGEVFAGGFEFGKFLKNFMVDFGIALGVGLVALWIFPPAGLVASIIGVVVGLLKGTGHRIRKLKDEFSNNIVGSLRQTLATKVSKGLEEIRSMFLDVKKSLLEGVDSEIATTRNQIEELRRITNADQESIEEKKTKINNLKLQLETIKTNMENLTAEVTPR